MKSYSKILIILLAAIVVAIGLYLFNLQDKNFVQFSPFSSATPTPEEKSTENLVPFNGPAILPSGYNQTSDSNR